ncbi:MAG: polysaccharide deacetylase family protein [Candidatus Acidiferrales bacterium]
MSAYVGSAVGGEGFLRRLPGRIIWRMPFRFQIARLAGPTYTLRCLLFHDIGNETSRFTEGLNVTLGTADFESKIKFVSQHYSPMTLQDFIDAFRQNALPPRPALVTFDDAYASVALRAAPILRKYKVPAVFFVVSSLVGNDDLGLDNLVCYVANTAGLKVVSSAAFEAVGRREPALKSLEQVFDDLLPAMSQKEIRKFREALAASAGIRTSDLARQAKLYVTAEQLRSLASEGFEIENHTLSHVFCRSLVSGEFAEEICANKTRLESITGRRVRGFSVPYGSPLDLTEQLAAYLRESGHEAIFLARSRSNTPATALGSLNRIDIHAGSDGEAFGEIEIYPRLRSLADMLMGKNRRRAEKHAGR